MITRANAACAASLLLALCTNASVAGEDWPRFRGVNGAGVSTSHKLPVEMGAQKNLIWKVAAPKGSSSPIIADGQLYFSSYEGKQRTLHCLDPATGKTRWTRSVTKIRDENATPPNGPATPTPASDGKNVFVLYPDAGVVCYTSAGQEKWKTDLQPFRSMHGIGSSLMTVNGLVIVVADQLADSYMAALNAETGKQVWKSADSTASPAGIRRRRCIRQPTERSGSWSPDRSKLSATIRRPANACGGSTASRTPPFPCQSSGKTASLSAKPRRADSLLADCVGRQEQRRQDFARGGEVQRTHDPPGRPDRQGLGQPYWRHRTGRVGQGVGHHAEQGRLWRCKWAARATSPNRTFDGLTARACRQSPRP